MAEFQAFSRNLESRSISSTQATVSGLFLITVDTYPQLTTAATGILHGLSDRIRSGYGVESKVSLFEGRQEYMEFIGELTNAVR